jgi:hypothetical protein
LFFRRFFIACEPVIHIYFFVCHKFIFFVLKYWFYNKFNGDRDLLMWKNFLL